MNIDNFTLSSANELRESDNYPAFLEGIKETFNDAICDHPILYQVRFSRPTGSTGGELYDIFLENLPEDARQHYNCFNCRQFVRNYGNMVRIDKVDNDYVIRSVVWNPDNVPDFFKPAVSALRRAVENGRVRHRVYVSARVVGNPITGPWHHMHLDFGTDSTYMSSTVNADICTASDEMQILATAVGMYSTPVIRDAIAILSSGKCYESDRILPMAKWFYSIVFDLRKDPRLTFDPVNLRPADNTRLWYESQNAPAGFNHIKNSVLGTMLDDLTEGMSTESVIYRFNEKTNSLSYQRPTAAPTDGQIDYANKRIVELGLAPSLNRRYATLDEVRTIWRPVVELEPLPSENAGIFDELRPKGKESELREVTVGRISWKTFERTVLLTAKRLQINIGTGQHMNFTAFVTAADITAPPIIMWDKADNRNPMSWYMIAGGAYGYAWNVTGTVDVTGIAYTPNLWQTGYEYIPTSAVFILEGCKPASQARKGPGLALFPEILRDDLKDCRKVIAAYSKAHEMSGADDATACGVAICKTTNERAFMDLWVTVTDEFGKKRYNIDRWE